MAVKAKELIGTRGVTMKVSEIKVEAGGSGFDTWGEHVFPDKHIVVVDVQNWYQNSVSLTYFAKGKESRAVLPNNFELEHVKRETKAVKELREAYVKEAMNGLQNKLGHWFYVGSDPEIFVENKNDGSLIPAFDFLPKKTGKAGVGQEVYWDGFQAEFTTGAFSCLAWHVDSVQKGLCVLHKEAKKYNKDATLSTKTVFDIQHETLLNTDEKYVQFGCMPSLNAYGLEGLKLDGRDVPFRPAGGHIHLGVGKMGEKNAIPIVKAMDAILGVACVSLFANFDDPRRRRMYGLPGEYRLPPHGLEYRVLSNAWLFHPMIMNIVFDLARKSAVFGAKGFLPVWNATEAETIDVITHCDVQQAREILVRNHDVLIKIISAIGGRYKGNEEMVFDIFLNGMEIAIADPKDFVKNWNLEGGWVGHSDGQGKNWLYSKELLAKGQKV